MKISCIFNMGVAIGPFCDPYFYSMDGNSKGDSKKR